MNEFYAEQLVKKKAGMKELLMKVLLVLMILVAVFLSLTFTFGFFIALAIIVAAVVLYQRLDVEYEYMYYNDEMDIDAIYQKAKRKRGFSVNVSDMEILAPIDAVELRQYQKAKTYDYSSGTGNAKLYAMVVAKDGQKTKIVFEPKQEIVEGFFLRAPRKVKRK